MAISSQPGRGFMEPDPDVPPFEWSRNGIASLWLIALILALVLWIGLLARSNPWL